MKEYAVLYREPYPAQCLEDAPMEVFLCQAESEQHAFDQAKDAYPDAQIYQIYVEVQ